MHLNWKFFLFEQKIQQELEVQQKKVDNSQDMVVVVDDTNTESGKGSGGKEVGGGWLSLLLGVSQIPQEKVNF